MTKRTQSPWHKLFTGFMTVFMLIGMVSTIGAMQANPPDNLDQVVLGNIDENLVELAAETNNEALITGAVVEQPENFFAATPDDGGGGQPDDDDNEDDIFFGLFDGE